MKTVALKKKNIEVKESPSDAETQGARPPSQSLGDFSTATFTESRNKMALFIESLVNGPEKFPNSYIFDRANELNNTIFQPKLLSDELIELYNSIVIYGRSVSGMVEEKPGGLAQSLTFKELMEQSFPKARFTIDPFFEAGTVNMISAPPNTWKSWLLFLMSSHIAEGSSLLDKFPTEKNKVMIVNEEDSFRAIQDRFKILNITDTTLPIFFRVANGSKLESKFVDKLLEELKEKQIGVVIFDSLRSMHEADENDSTAMQKILDQMKRLSREGITVIFTHHHRKKGMFEKSSSAESSRGSSAINAAISGHISLDEEERDDGLYLIIRHLKSKAGEKLDPFEVKITKNEGKIKFVYEGEFKAAEKKIKQTKDQIMEILGDGKWKCKKDFDKVMTVSKTVLHQAIQALKNDGMILSITRKEAIEKKIPVTEKGKVNELYYSLNTESAELVTRKDEAMAQDNFDDF